MSVIVDVLFPTHAERECENILAEGVGVVLPFNVAELHATTDSLGSFKAPGPNVVLREAIRTTVKECPYLFLNMYNRCLRVGVFGRRWNVQRLLLLDKRKGPPINAS